MEAERPTARVALVATVAFRPTGAARLRTRRPRRAPPQTIKFKKNRPEQPVRGSRPRAPRGVSALAHGARARVSAGARVQYRPSCEAKNVEAPVPSTDRFLRRAPARPGRPEPVPVGRLAALTRSIAKYKLTSTAKYSRKPRGVVRSVRATARSAARRGPRADVGAASRQPGQPRALYPLFRLRFSG